MSGTEIIVLAGILPDSPTRMERAVLDQMSPSNFANEFHRQLFDFMLSFYDEHMAILPRWAMAEKAKKAGVAPERVKLMEALYDEYSKAEVPEPDFRAALKYLKENEIARRTEDMIVTGMEILKGTYYDEKTDSIVRGQESAREYLTEALRQLSSLEADAAPEGDMRDDIEEIWKTYVQKEEAPDEETGIRYGIPEVDEFTGGVRAGELVLIAGFTASGKSQMVTSMAWNAMLSKKNVIMFTTETTREEMEIRILARHSRLPQFKKPTGLDSHEIMHATLSPSDREVFKEVLKDFRTRDTGNLIMVQMPSDGRSDYVMTKSYQYNRKTPIDLVVVDSINLLRTPGKPENKRIMLEDLLQDFKRFASSFDGGRGVAVVSPWQISRTAWREAVEAEGEYTMASLSDTAEAERCQPLHSKVLTVDGFITMEDVVVGTQLLGPDSKVKEVTDVYDNGERPIFIVSTDDGAEVECTPGHVWRVHLGEGLKFEDLTTEQIQKELESGTEIYLPLPTAHLNTKEILPNISPYEAHYLAAALRERRPYRGVLTLTPDDPSYIATVFQTPPQFASIRPGNKGLTTFEFSEESLLNSNIYPYLRESGLFTGDRTQFRVPEYYMNTSLKTKEIILRAFLKESKGVWKKPPAPGWWNPRSIASSTLENQLRHMILSNGWAPGATPRRITLVTDTGRVEKTKCFSVEGDLYITDGYVVTHNSPSQIITIFKMGDRLLIQVLKNRSGKEMPKISYPYDYRNSYIGAAEDAEDLDDSVGGTNTRGNPNEERASFNSALQDIMG